MCEIEGEGGERQRERREEGGRGERDREKERERERFMVCMFPYSWCFLYDLLVSSLYAAVPLEQVDGVAMLVSKHLHFHMPAE